MGDPLRLLTSLAASAIEAAFGRPFDPVVRRSQNERFGDFQVNAAMAIAKEVGASPREVAATIVSHLDVGAAFEEPEIAGPGFVNFRVRNEYLAEAVTDAAEVSPAAVRETVVVDYSSPNVAKEMHVGHLRSSVIGDALVRVLDAVGHRVVRQNHLGDWGTQFGMLIEHLSEVGYGGGGIGSGDLNAVYQEAQGRFEREEEFAERARRRVVALQGGDEETLSAWRGLVAESERYFESAYRRLGVLLKHDDVRGESFYNPLLADVVAELRDKGLLVEDDGALCVFPEGFVGRDGSPLPMIVQKSDGGYGYAATDLAALRFRVRELGASRVAYVVDARQSSHFAMLFAVAGAAGWLDGAARAEHVAFGTILGEDGRPFRTRSGDTVRLVALLDEAVERAARVVAEKSPGLSDDEQHRVAEAVGIGAIKYADLANDRVKDYVFSWDRMLAMEGNTAPYLQYAHARIQSILRKAGEAAEAGAGADAAAAPGEVTIGHPAERALALQLTAFDEAVQVTAALLEPHRLCTYLFELASLFTTFYEHCPVLRAETDALRASRLALARCTADVLRTGLGLLGITAPTRM